MWTRELPEDFSWSSVVNSSKIRMCNTNVCNKFGISRNEVNHTIRKPRIFKQLHQIISVNIMWVNQIFHWLISILRIDSELKRIIEIERKEMKMKLCDDCSFIRWVNGILCGLPNDYISHQSRRCWEISSDWSEIEWS